MDYELIPIDEVSFQLATGYKRIWFLKGEKPKRAFFWSNKKLTVFGALTSSKKFYYEFYTSQNMITFSHFLWSLFEQLDRSKKYILIMDNASYHKTEYVQNLLQEYNSWIVVEPIPPYSPELNPIETCWKVTKNAVTKSQHFKDTNEMKGALEEFWQEHTFTQSFMRYLCL